MAIRGLIFGSLAFAAAFGAERLFAGMSKDIARYDRMRAMSGEPPLGRQLLETLWGGIGEFGNSGRKEASGFISLPHLGRRALRPHEGYVSTSLGESVVRFAVASGESWLTFEARSTLHPVHGKAANLEGFIEAAWEAGRLPCGRAARAHARRISRRAAALRKRDAGSRDVEGRRQQTLSTRRGGSAGVAPAAVNRDATWPPARSRWRAARAATRGSSPSRTMHGR